MQRIGPVSEYPHEGIYQISLQDQAYLLINHDSHFYCIEDKCGHFGVSLARGKIQDRKIICPQHHISFDLSTGEIVDHLGENCEPVKALSVIENHGILFCES